MELFLESAIEYSTKEHLVPFSASLLKQSYELLFKSKQTALDNEA